ncbi:MAG TPA: nuclear transport factor 2 family protein [Solirubrobacteraceae bacterium]|nr:nuclear transport factor 2 family protein [Solirubrobacteraceae bacterium]
MSHENVELVRGIYEAWRNGTSARGFMDPQIEYVNPHDAVEPGIRHGPESFAKVRDAYDDVRVEPTEFIDAGEDVVVLATIHAEGRASGLAVDWQHGYVWTVEGGKAVRFRWFNAPGEALEAAGLPPRA